MTVRVHDAGIDGEDTPLLSPIRSRTGTTWCAPCRDELPRLSRLSRQLADKDVHFVATSIDEAKDRHKIEPFLQVHGTAE